MACRGQIATLTTSDAGRVEQIRCDGQRCDMTGASALGLPDGAEAVDLGGRVALLWIDDHRTFLRAGALAELDAAPDQLLFDDAEHGGLDAAIEYLEPAPGGARALFYDHASDRLYALAIDASGKAAPLPVSQAAR